MARTLVAQATILVRTRPLVAWYLYVYDPTVGLDDIEDWWFDPDDRTAPAAVTIREAQEIRRQLTDIARSV
jgi:hypothetical protein